MATSGFIAPPKLHSPILQGGAFLEAHPSGRRLEVELPCRTRSSRLRVNNGKRAVKTYPKRDRDLLACLYLHQKPIITLLLREESPPTASTEKVGTSDPKRLPIYGE